MKVYFLLEEVVFDHHVVKVVLVVEHLLLELFVPKYFAMFLQGEEVAFEEVLDTMQLMMVVVVVVEVVEVVATYFVIANFLVAMVLMFEYLGKTIHKFAVLATVVLVLSTDSIFEIHLHLLEQALLFEEEQIVVVDQKHQQKLL